MVTLHQIISALGGELQSQEIACAEVLVGGISSVYSAQADHLVFIAHRSLISKLPDLQARVVVVPYDYLPDLPACKTIVVAVDNPRLYCSRILEMFFSRLQAPSVAGVHPSVEIPDSAVIAEDCSIDPHVVIGENVRIGSGTRIFAGCVLGDSVEIGCNTVLYPHVVCYDHVVIADQVIVHSGVIIGADGFGFVKQHDRAVKLYHAGMVYIDDEVEIGAGTCIDRAMIGRTYIGKRVKIDNHVHIAHGVEVGDDAVLVAGCKIGGSSQIGCRVLLYGCAVVIQHVFIADRVTVLAGSLVVKSIRDEGAVYSSAMPAMEQRLWRRLLAVLRRISRGLSIPFKAR